MKKRQREGGRGRWDVEGKRDIWREWGIAGQESALAASQQHFVGGFKRIYHVVFCVLRPIQSK